MRRFALLVVVTACARAGDGTDSPGTVTDAPPGAVDAPVDCTTMQMFYRDADNDGHGNAAQSMLACTAPTGMVTTMDDCDDTTANRRPGLAEYCDGLDNDCNPATNDPCPANCTPARRPAPDDLVHVYLACAINATWQGARNLCAQAGHKLVQVEDAAENAFLRLTANGAFGPGFQVWIGGSDGVEGAWVWDGSDPFWSGGPGGTAVGGRFANWGSGEPNNDDNEDCSEMRTDAKWNDVECGEGRPFICRH